MILNLITWNDGKLGNVYFCHHSWIDQHRRSIVSSFLESSRTLAVSGYLLDHLLIIILDRCESS